MRRIAEVAAPARPRDVSALSGFISQLPDHGSFSLWAGPVMGDPVLAHRADEPHYAASMMKLALVIAAHRLADVGELDLDRPVAVSDEFISATGTARFSVDCADDSDPEPWRRMGSTVALRWLCYRAIVRSSNLATNLVLAHVGLNAVAETLTAVGATNSVVSRGIEDAPAREAGLDNLVTAADLGLTLQSLAAGRAASPPACRQVLSILGAQQINDALPAGLPAGTRVAHKSGWVEGVSHDAGIIWPSDAAPFLLVMCTTSDLDEQQGLDLIAAGAAAAWRDRKVLG